MSLKFYKEFLSFVFNILSLFFPLLLLKKGEVSDFVFYISIMTYLIYIVISGSIIILYERFSYISYVILLILCLFLLNSNLFLDIVVALLEHSSIRSYYSGSSTKIIILYVVASIFLYSVIISPYMACVNYIRRYKEKMIVKP